MYPQVKLGDVVTAAGFVLRLTPAALSRADDVVHVVCSSLGNYQACKRDSPISIHALNFVERASCRDSHLPPQHLA